jgi:hypothetical protein
MKPIQVSFFGCVLALALFSLSACTTTTSKKIVGTNVPTNLKDFEGKWRYDLSTERSDKKKATDDGVTFNIKDATAGLLSVVTAEAKDKTEKGEEWFYLRTLGGKTFVSATKDNEIYYFGLVVFTGDNSIVVVRPDNATFARLVDSGVLRGNVTYDSQRKPSNIVLEGLSEEECGKLFSGAYVDCFDWMHPLVFLRVPGS